MQQLKHQTWVASAAGWLVVIGLGLAGCPASPQGGGNGGGEKSLTLSKTTADPGEFISLSHVDIHAGDALTVEFRTGDGLVVRVESEDASEGQLRVAVPAHLDGTNGSIGAGALAVSIQGLQGAADLQVNDLMALEGVEPGTILRLLLQSAIDDYARTLQNLADMGQQLGEAQGANAVDAINTRMAELQQMLSQLDTTGSIPFDLGGDIGVVTVSEDSLKLADRYLANMIAGLEAEVSANQKGFASFRSINECIPTPPPGLTINQCMGEVLQGIKQFTQEKGTRLAGYLATGVGVVVTIAGLAVEAPLIALTGVIVGVAGGAVSFTDAALQGKNTDSFLTNDGEGFNVGVEIISQTGRVLVSAWSTGTSALQNAFSSAVDALDKGIVAMDGYNALKCDEKPPDQKIRPVMQTLEEIGFCTITRPPGCSNSCTFAFNGRCEDGGSGSVSSLCASGTDCLDCGPREDDDTTDTADGACCLAGATCAITTGSDCAAGGGTYQGDGTECSPNPCSTPVEPTGACCSAGVCTEVTSSACAATSGAVYSGDGTDCATTQCVQPPEYVVWYTGNVCCWGAPLLFITERSGFESEQSASSFPGGGIDGSIPAVKVELMGGFASAQEARDWVCPQFTSSSFHYWCDRHYQMDGKNWQITGSVGCTNLGSLPEPTAYPETNLCQ